MIVGYKTPRGTFVAADRAVVRGKRVMTNVVTPRGTTLVKSERFKRETPPVKR